MEVCPYPQCLVAPGPESAVFFSEQKSETVLESKPCKSSRLTFMCSYFLPSLRHFHSQSYTAHGLSLFLQKWRSISLMSPWHLGSNSFWSLATIDWDINHITLCSLEKAEYWQHSLPHCSDESHNPLCRVINYPFVCIGCSDRVFSMRKEGNLDITLTVVNTKQIE